MTYEEIEDDIRNAIVRLYEAASAYTKLFETGSHERVYRVARKICEAQGYDPDRISMGGDGQHPMFDAKKSTAILHPIRPNWMLYVQEARAAIELVESTK